MCPAQTGFDLCDFVLVPELAARAVSLTLTCDAGVMTDGQVNHQEEDDLGSQSIGGSTRSRGQATHHPDGAPALMQPAAPKPVKKQSAVLSAMTLCPLLELTILAGRDLLAADIGGTSDPFCNVFPLDRDGKVCPTSPTAAPHPPFTGPVTDCLLSTAVCPLTVTVCCVDHSHCSPNHYQRMWWKRL